MKIYGIKVDGMFTKEDGTTLGWGEFLEKIEAVGMFYDGYTRWADSETGENEEGIETSIK